MVHRFYSHLGLHAWKDAGQMNAPGRPCYGEVWGTGETEGSLSFWPRGRVGLAGADTGPGIFTGSTLLSSASMRFASSWSFRRSSLLGNPQYLLRQRTVRRVGEMTTKREQLKGKTLLSARWNSFVHLQEGQDDSRKFRWSLKL